MYQAAVKSGFKITERHKHSLPVSYAKDDAAVAWPSQDLRFINTYKNSVKIVIQETKDSLKVSFVDNASASSTETSRNSDETLVYIAGRAFPGINSKGVVYIPLRVLAQEIGAELVVADGFAIKKDNCELLKYSGSWVVKGSFTGGPKPLLKGGRWYVPYEKALSILS